METATSPTATAAQEVIVTYPRWTSIGGGDPVTSEGRSFRARYQPGCIFTSRIEDGEEVWEACFTVEGAPELGDRPIKRAMTNHGTFAAYQGGRPVVITKA